MWGTHLAPLVNNATGAVCAPAAFNMEDTMELMTDELRKKLPPLYGTEHEPAAIAQVKYFTPWTNWTWYGVEFDGEDTFFGLVEGFEKEWGYFSLRELESIQGPGGLRIERDLLFRPRAVGKRGRVDAALLARIDAMSGDE